jgi:hypothetical protein
MALINRAGNNDAQAFQIATNKNLTIQDALV